MVTIGSGDYRLFLSATCGGPGTLRILRTPAGTSGGFAGIRVSPARKGSVMARRSRDWNRGLAQDLQDPAFAREFLLAASEDGVSVQRALGKVIRAMGVRAFAMKVRMADPNVLRAIDPRHNPTQETLNRLLRPFRLRIGVAPIAGGRNRDAA
jgi:DNA-binding phage protein